MTKVRALSVGIFESKKIGNCSNHGISERFNEILLICEDGNVEVDLDNPPENLCRLVRRNLWGEEHDYVEPYAEPYGVGWMSGGSIVYSCDARFGRMSNHPLCLHDRTETQEQYDMMSN